MRIGPSVVGDEPNGADELLCNGDQVLTEASPHLLSEKGAEHCRRHGRVARGPLAHGVRCDKGLEGADDALTRDLDTPSRREAVTKSREVLVEPIGDERLTELARPVKVEMVPCTRSSVGKAGVVDMVVYDEAPQRGLVHPDP